MSRLSMSQVDQEPAQPDSSMHVPGKAAGMGSSSFFATGRSLLRKAVKGAVKQVQKTASAVAQTVHIATTSVTPLSPQDLLQYGQLIHSVSNEFMVLGALVRRGMLLEYIPALEARLSSGGDEGLFLLKDERPSTNVVLEVQDLKKRFRLAAALYPQEYFQHGLRKIAYFLQKILIPLLLVDIRDLLQRYLHKQSDQVRRI
jgi:hypothetical protein